MKKIIEKVFNNKAKLYNPNNNDWERNTRSLDWRDLPLYNVDELMTIPDYLLNKLDLSEIFKGIDKQFRNKVFDFGDYKLHIQYYIYNHDKDEIKKRIDDFNAKTDYRYNYSTILYGNETEVYTFLISYNGYYKKIGQVETTKSTEIEYYSKDGFNRNFGRTTIANNYTPEKNCILKSISLSINYNNFNVELFNIIDNLTLNNTKPDNLPFINSYPWVDNSYGIKRIDINELNKKVDINFFILNDTEDGVFKPTQMFINDIVPLLGTKKNIKKIGIDTIKLTSKEYFNIKYHFNLKDIIVKAPKSVVAKYNLEKYIKDDKIIKQIKKEQEKLEKLEKLSKYNDTFDLVFHGKVIKKSVSSYDIIHYLENKKNTNLEKNILKSFKKIFDKFTEIKKFYLCDFGTFYKYELSGERYFNTDISNEHISNDILNEIYDFYEDDLIYPDETYINIMYGIPERGGLKLGIKKVGKSLKFFTEDYNPE